MSPSSKCVPSVSELYGFLRRSLGTEYDLIYVHYGDSLSDQGIRAVFYNEDKDWETYWEECSEWEGDSRWSGAKHVAEEVATQGLKELRLLNNHMGPEYNDAYVGLAEDWEISTEQMELIDDILELDNGDWFKTLLAGAPDQECHVDLGEVALPALAESFLSSRRLFDAIGAPITTANIDTVDKVIAEEGWDGGQVYACFKVSLVDMNNLPHDCTRIVVDQIVLLIDDAECPIEGSMIFDRSDLVLEQDGPGIGLGRNVDVSSITPLPSDREVDEVLATIRQEAA